MPLTDQEIELERRIEDLARMQYSVEIDRIFGIRVGDCGRGHGAPWAARLRRHAIAYPEGFGNTGIEALEDAVDQARAQGAQ